MSNHFLLFEYFHPTLQISQNQYKKKGGSEEEVVVYNGAVRSMARVMRPSRTI